MPVVVFYSTNTIAVTMRWIFTWFTPFQFVKCLQDINLLAVNQNPGLQSSAPGYTWSDFTKNPVYNSLAGINSPEIPSTWNSIQWMLLNTCIYIFLTWYLDNIWPDEFGTPKPFYFFILPSYWGITKPSSKHSETTYLLHDVNILFFPFWLI